MPVHFLDNYPKSLLTDSIKKKDNTPLYGEIWVYNQFLEINKNNLLPDETWYLKHDYNLSIHPESRGKVEGQIDFLLLTKNGIIVIEVKGGSIRVDENDCFYSSNKTSEYQTQNPFIQAKEYIHTLKNLIDKPKLFISRAIVFPHEAGFNLNGPQLIGYKYCFYSKRDFGNTDSSYGITKSFFDFISKLSYKAKKHNIRELRPNLKDEEINRNIFQIYPVLSKAELQSVKKEFFPSQSTYGYNPEKINSELILTENYEIFQGLRKNQKIMVQGGPGTGKTVLAQKYIADKLLKHQNGIVFCANKLVRSKLEYLILNEYKMDPNNVSFKIFHKDLMLDESVAELDFIVFDEAQEYFDKGLLDVILALINKRRELKLMLLYDPEQTIVADNKELTWYTDFLLSEGFTHYYFDKNYRCIQDSKISKIAAIVQKNQFNKLTRKYNEFITTVSSSIEKLSLIKLIKNDNRFTPNEVVILIQSNLISDFKRFNNNLEELTEANINNPTNNIRYTTPIKFRGLESKSVYIVTDELVDKNKVQLYIGITRSIHFLKIVKWKK